MSRVLVTGATGFVGTALCMRLADAGYRVRAALRSPCGVPGTIPEQVVIGDIASPVNCAAAFEGVNAVVHLAARTHVPTAAPDEISRCMAVNAHGTRQLALAGVNAGVRRFVYLSSIKVNGEEAARAYTLRDPPRPSGAYGASKLLGEQYLHDVAESTCMQTVVVRPPLVYGPGVRANFLRLLTWVDRRWPLPFGAVDNRRSLISVWNLCDMILHVLQSPLAVGRTWFAADAHDISTPQLIRNIAKAMDRPAKLLSVPDVALTAAGALLGRRTEIARLCGSLIIDMRQTCDELRWSPPCVHEDAIARTVDWYLREARARGR